jgi:hypothetical protein
VPSLTPEFDQSCSHLALYLKDGLNNALAAIAPGITAVKDAVNYDCLPDLSRFPLIKVYRVTKRYTGSVSGETSAIAAYCLDYPLLDALPGVTNWAADTIVSLLLSYNFNVDDCPPMIEESDITAEYRIMLNEITQAAYPFLKVNFRFRD